MFYEETQGQGIFLKTFSPGQGVTLMKLTHGQGTFSNFPAAAPRTFLVQVTPMTYFALNADITKGKESYKK